jgi:site-specific recombinase XerD
MSMNTYLHEFAVWLRNEDKGELTVRTYLSVLEKFVSWFEKTEGTPFQPQKVTPLLLQDYRSYLQDVENRKPATINKALAAFKTFFAWTLDAGYTDTNPALKVKMKRIQQTHAPKWLNAQEQNRLLYALETERNPFKQARDQAVVLTMLYAGLRVEEVSQLKIHHIDLKEETIHVFSGKGGTFRSVPMKKELKKALRSWLKFRTESEKPVHQQSDFLFVSERSGKMTTRGLAYLVDTYLERAGLLQRTAEGFKTEGQFSCHSLRHTFCKNLVNAGWPIQNVARVAGHESIQTTLRYVEPSEEELKKAMQSV